MGEELFFEQCRKHRYTERDLARFQQALEYAKKVLAEEKRLVGESKYTHNLAVATTLVENTSEPDVIIAGLLLHILRHGSEKEIEQRFGKSIVTLLKQIDELSEIKERNEQLQSEAVRKILLTTIQDVRVFILKLASKLQNMKSIHVFPPAHQHRLAEEVLEIYAPLAYRLGIERMRVELEDLAFQVLHPQEYDTIDQFLEESREERQRNVEHFMEVIRSLCQDSIPIISIKGRPKHIHSIYKKIQSKKLQLEDLHDLLGVRVIVPTVKDCYTLLGLLHEKFESIEGRLKDYIANPKPNFYRSIHTSLKLPHGKTAEVQIRTKEMDEFAEEGLAAHWRYKGLKSDEIFEKKIAWLRGILDLQKTSEGQEFMETVKVDLFGDKIYCYTPKGDIKELPKGATILDFAYLVHEQIGNTCVGARVNGKFVPIKHVLQSGDVIEILTNKKQRPRRGWLKIVTSSKSRQKIRKSLKEHEKLAALHFHVIKPVSQEEQGVLVHSEEFPKAFCHLAKCCHPLPGDPIIGMVTKRRLISVHIDSCRLANKEQNRWIKVQWKNEFNQRIKFQVEAQERSGLLADLLHTIATAGFEVKEATAKMLGSTHALCSFTVIPRDLEQLKELIRRVRKVKGTQHIYFE